LRTFLAIELPAVLQTVLQQTQSDLQRSLPTGQLPTTFQWTAVANLHLTLRFLGETSPTQQATLAHALGELTQATPPFVLALGALGAFPNWRKPNVVWLGVQGDLGALQELQAQVEAAVQAVGFVPAEQAFTPHLTLARARRTADSLALRAAGERLSALTPSLVLVAAQWPVMQLVHLQSELGRERAHYTPLAHLTLGAKAE
jgi:RNA 2',3'-cyclic 3'-phosphodiesterase